LFDFRLLQVHVRTPSSARTACASTRIGPGFIETPLNEKVRASNPELAKTFIAHTPLGRAGKAEPAKAGDPVFQSISD
jgi:hypothetical protein